MGKLKERVRTWLDGLAGRWLSGRGYEVVGAEAATAGRAELRGLSRYVQRSGHLHTVRGRRPRAVDRVQSATETALVLLSPVEPGGKVGSEGAA